MRTRDVCVLWFVLSALGVSALATELTGDKGTGLSRDSVLQIVSQIQRADYEGDRAALQRLYAGLLPVPRDDKKLASRIHYWRGFALWRRALNGFNENVDPNQLFAAPGPQNSNSATVFGTPTFGFVTAAQAPREIQVAGKLYF